jgi:hypothetical protein
VAVTTELKMRSAVSLELDHAFICCTAGAPEAEALLRLGLVEGSPNVHPGQGTANRRFFFRNAYLELLWVSDPAQACSEQTRRTRLWQRWTQRRRTASPFGLVFRSTGGDRAAAAPFATWAYRPNYLPPGLAIEFADAVALDEPELVYLPFVQRSLPPSGEPVEHAVPLQRLLGVTVGMPGAAELSAPSAAARSAGLVAYREAVEPVLEMNFEAARPALFDLRPTLPLLLRGVVQDSGSALR